MNFRVSPQEKRLLLISAFFLLVALLSALNGTILLLVHAFNRNFYSGFSIGKLILSLAFFVALPLLSVAAIRLGLPKKLARFERFSLILFALFVSLGFLLGAVQYASFSSQYAGKWQFASFVSEPGYTNWEASKFYHNHFPKLTVHFVLQSLGTGFGGQFDDGRPWFELFPQAELWASAFVVILLVVLIAGLLHLFSRLNSIKWFDFLLFSAAFLGFFIYILDGGLAAGPFVVIVFFFLLYVARSYLRLPFNESLFALAVSAGLLALSIGMLDYYMPTSVYQLAPMFSLSLGYYFYSLFRGKKLKISIVNVVLLVLFLYSFSLWIGLLDTYALGRVLVDYRAQGLLGGADEGAAFFAYGLPARVSEQELSAAVGEFGVPLEVKKTGWTAYVRFSPAREVREREVEAFLRERFSPQTYLYIDEGAPIRTVSTVEVYWFSDVNSSEFLRNEFNDLRVVERIEKPETQSTLLVVEGRTALAWRLLSVLTEARENGFKGKLLAAN